MLSSSDFLISEMINFRDAYTRSDYGAFPEVVEELDTPDRGVLTTSSDILNPRGYYIYHVFGELK